MAGELARTIVEVNAVLIDAVGIVRGRLFDMAVESKAAAEAARLAGQSQFRALNANAPERARLSLILPCLPDNDRINDWLRVSNGLPSLMDCPIPERTPR